MVLRSLEVNMAVYEKSGGYTDKSYEFDRKVHKALDCIVREAMEDGMEIEEVVYIVHRSAYLSALRYRMGKMLNREFK